MNTDQLRKIIKEAITDRLKMIDEAGDKAAIQAKISKIDEDIKEAKQIKSSIPTNLKHFVDPEIVSDMSDDLDKSIKELEIKKKEFEDQIKKLDKTPTETNDKKEELEESFKQLVGKLKKQGKSNKTATKIAGAVASAKLKGAGTGPTAKQKARVKEGLPKGYFKKTYGAGKDKKQIMYSTRKTIKECSECGKHEALMVKSELRNLIISSAELYKMISSDQHLPEWVVSKIAVASTSINGISEYMSELNSEMMNEVAIATSYQFTENQLSLLKKYGAFLSTGGNTLYIPDLLKIQLDQNVKDSKFKQEFYETFGPERKNLASQLMTAMKLALKKGGSAKIKDKTYHVINGHMTSKGNFNFPNPSRPEK
jgi:uncharacterized coiled-coil protein SlyX